MRAHSWLCRRVGKGGGGGGGGGGDGGGGGSGGSLDRGRRGNHGGRDSSADLSVRRHVALHKFVEDLGLLNGLLDLKLLEHQPDEAHDGLLVALNNVARRAKLQVDPGQLHGAQKRGAVVDALHLKRRGVEPARLGGGVSKKKRDAKERDAPGGWPGRALA